MHSTTSRFGFYGFRMPPTSNTSIEKKKLGKIKLKSASLKNFTKTAVF